MARLIGLRHREKKTVEGESHPTSFYITEDGKEPQVIEFEEIVDELSWLVGRLPVSYREVTDNTEDISVHGDKIKWVRVEEDLTIEARHPSQMKQEKGKQYLARKVPAAYDGVREDDTYVAMMGGSGHQLVAGLSARLEKLGGSGKVLHASAHKIAEIYGVDRDKAKDPERVVELYKTQPLLFYRVALQDRKISLVRSCWARRQAAQYARIAHALRLRKVAIMEAYADPEHYAGAGLEVETLKLIAGDVDTPELEGDESDATSALDEAVQDTEVWQKIFAPIDGVGPAIAGGLIAAIGDIRRFNTPWQLAKFCGVAVVTKDQKGNLLPRATIQRRRSGGLGSAWNMAARKALWNFSTQCVQWKKNSEWGQHYQKLVQQTLAMHPVPVEDRNKDGKKVQRYTEAHCKKIARWRLQTDFVCVIWRQWKRIFKYPGDQYFTLKRNDLRPPGNRNTEVITPDIAA
jgi:hypothetical protein